MATLSVIDLELHSAPGGGCITNDGGYPVTERGLVWGFDPNPTLADNRNVEGEGMGTFRSLMEELLPDQIYYFRAYAINAAGTSYGGEQQFMFNQRGFKMRKTYKTF